MTRCPTCHRKHTRTHPQNARYWLLIHLIAEKVKPEGETYSPDSWHEYFAGRFLGKTELRLPNGEIVKRRRSTTETDVAEFNDYMARVEEWARDRNVWLEEIEGAT